MNTVTETIHSSSTAALWQPISIGRMRLSHRLAMAPMTRSRADSDGSPNPLMAEYYAQRAGLGLLISEGTQPSADGQGYLVTPGIHTDAHVFGWRQVADAVHARGGHLFIQLMHVGRMAHPDNTPHHRQPVAPSAIAPGVDMFTAEGMQPAPTPRALSRADIAETVADFADAAERAIEAGANGVEIHAANGYLIQQFFAPNANQRNDEYGGSITNRIRFALEVVTAVTARIGSERVGIRLSPAGQLGGLDEGPNGPDLYRQLVASLAAHDLAYLHLVHAGDEELLGDIRAAWPNALLVNRAGRPLDAVGGDVQAGLADVAVVARWALANPDLVKRIQHDQPLNEVDMATVYGGGAAGYTDYPTLAEAI